MIAVNPVKAGLVEPTQEHKDAVDAVNAELKQLGKCAIADHKPGVPIVIKGNSTPINETMIREDTCPQCRGYMVAFRGVKYCSECGLKKGTMLERDLKAKQNNRPDISKPIIINGNSTREKEIRADMADFYPTVKTSGKGK